MGRCPAGGAGSGCLCRKETQQPQPLEAGGAGETVRRGWMGTWGDPARGRVGELLPLEGSNPPPVIPQPPGQTVIPQPPLVKLTEQSPCGNPTRAT